jgi:hypothetical protein
MPTFENGWICRQCWCSNREYDGRCYRCHADRDPATVRSEPRPVDRPAPSALEASPQPVVSHLLSAVPKEHAAAGPAPAARQSAFCSHCHQPLSGDESFCTKCGAPTTLSAAVAEPKEPVVTTARGEVVATPAAVRRTIEIPNPLEWARRGYRLVMTGLRSVFVTITAPVRAVATFYRNTRMGISRAGAGVRGLRHNATIVLFVGWVVLMALAAVLLAGLGDAASAAFPARAVSSMAIVLTVGAFSAVTAALTVLMMGGRVSDRAQARPQAHDEAQGGPARAMADHRPA